MNPANTNLAGADNLDDWSVELAELQQRRALSQALGGAESIQRHHANGRKTIRERLIGVLDQESFQEVGTLTGKSERQGGKLERFTPAPYVCGLG